MEMRVFEITAHMRRKVAKRRMCFWNTLWVLCRRIAMITRRDRKRALIALRYATMVRSLARGFPPELVRRLRRLAALLYKRCPPVIRCD
jgi:hypothetical protein